MERLSHSSTTSDVPAPEFSPDVAADASIAADDEFLARQRRRSRRWRVILLVLLFAAIPMLAGIYLGPSLLPESTGQLQNAHRELVKLHQEIEFHAGDRDDPAKWDAYRGRVSKRLHDATKPIASSKHRAKQSLAGAKSALNSAIRATTQEDFDRKLKHAAKMLDDAKKKLGL